jgi:hypothetical protein
MNIERFLEHENSDKKRDEEASRAVVESAVLAALEKCSVLEQASHIKTTIPLLEEIIALGKAQGHHMRVCSTWLALYKQKQYELARQL